MKKIISKNEKETLRFAKKFAKSLRGGEVVGLIGELGAGKTVFVKGLARGLGVRQEIHSPTFLLMKIYNVRPSTNSGHKIKHLCHVDAYRLTGTDELIDVGLTEWLGKDNIVTVIEWADKVPELLRGKKVIKINFEFGERAETRILEIIQK